MIAAIDYAGIPITLPVWTQVVSYLFLALIAAGIGVAAWRTAITQKDRTQVGEIHAKVNLMMLIIRGWQEREQNDYTYGEHYAPEAPAEITDEHERVPDGT